MYKTVYSENVMWEVLISLGGSERLKRKKKTFPGEGGIKELKDLSVCP